MIGIIGLTYGLRENEPSPNTRILAREFELARFTLQQLGEQVLTIAQWEINLALPDPADHIVWPYPDRYLSTADVIGEAADFLNHAGSDEAVLVTRSGLHRRYSEKLAHQAGLKVLDAKTPGRLSYDPESLQWWTRGPLRELAHAAQQQLSGRPGRFIPTSQLLDYAR